MATANSTDMSILATDSTFANRVAIELAQYCWNVVASEAITTATLPQHIARKNLASQILNNPSQFNPRFVTVVASNQTVADQSVANGTLVGQGTAAVATAAALVTDANINNAIAASFNAFIPSI